MICPHCKDSFDVEVEEFVKHTKNCEREQFENKYEPDRFDSNMNNQHKKEVEDVRN